MRRCVARLEACGVREMEKGGGTRTRGWRAGLVGEHEADEAELLAERRDVRGGGPVGGRVVQLEVPRELVALDELDTLDSDGQRDGDDRVVQDERGDQREAVLHERRFLRRGRAHVQAQVPHVRLEHRRHQQPREEREQHEQKQNANEREYLHNAHAHAYASSQSLSLEEQQATIAQSLTITLIKLKPVVQMLCVDLLIPLIMC